MLLVRNFLCEAVSAPSEQAQLWAGAPFKVEPGWAGKGSGLWLEKRHILGQALIESTQKPRGLLVTTPPRSTRALEMLLKLRKSSCCWGSDCRAVMFSRIRAAAWGGRGKEGVQTCPLNPLKPPVLSNSGSHLDTPAVTEHFLMLGCGVAFSQGS